MQLSEETHRQSIALLRDPVEAEVLHLLLNLLLSVNTCIILCSTGDINY